VYFTNLSLLSKNPLTFFINFVLIELVSGDVCFRNFGFLELSELAISIFASNGFLQGEIFGRDKFITFSGNNVNQLYKDITANNGLNLLNEHH